MKGIIYLLCMLIISVFVFMIEQSIVNTKFKCFFKYDEPQRTAQKNGDSAPWMQGKEITSMSTRSNVLTDRTTARTEHHAAKKAPVIDQKGGDESNNLFSGVTFEFEPKKSCSRTKNIVFLKTHKTGSSTITSILNRYADLYDLIMLLPASPFNRFLYPNPFYQSFIDEDFIRFNKKANILANHARMNKPEMEKVMFPNSKYITIIRHPITQFESSFFYFELDKVLELNKDPDPIGSFLKNVAVHAKKINHKKHLDHFGLLRNGMLFDLGLEDGIGATGKGIRDTVKKVEQEFDLVLITEYFDESLVLLMRTFCWSLDDIMYLKQNERSHKRKRISAESIELLKKWNEGDFKLYEKFNRTFWEKIEAEGPTFWDDVKKFRARKKAVTKHCGLIHAKRNAHKSDISINQFKLSYINALLIPFCKKLLTSEVDYLNYFRKKYSIPESMKVKMPMRPKVSINSKIMAMINMRQKMPRIP